MVRGRGDRLITICMAMEIKLGEPLIPSIVTAAFIKIYLRFRISSLDFLLL